MLTINPITNVTYKVIKNTFVSKTAKAIFLVVVFAGLVTAKGINVGIKIEIVYTKNEFMYLCPDDFVNHQNKNVTIGDPNHKAKVIKFPYLKLLKLKIFGPI